MVGALTAIIALAVFSTLLNLLVKIVPVDGWSTIALGVTGILVTIVVARTGYRIQGEVRNIQRETQDFLMGKVNSRSQRTSAIIDMCTSADQTFCAATFFPAVGIRDRPDYEPMTYLRALEVALSAGVEVTLISVSLEEAKEYCEGRDEFSKRCVMALEEVHRRLNEVQDRVIAGTLDGTLERWELAGSQLTVNMCYNDSTALIYHMSLDGEDEGAGFKSADDRVLEVARGGFSRYLALVGGGE